jgi:hypothetical protein
LFGAFDTLSQIAIALAVIGGFYLCGVYIGLWMAAFIIVVAVLFFE